ncbi:hypothetical protein EAF00_006615 [Botryotinia globosa]|nr:hypothetical protein EAF00_006615 [Botryotinia globosa]
MSWLGGGGINPRYLQFNTTQSYMPARPLCALSALEECSCSYVWKVSAENRFRRYITGAALAE